MSRAEAQRAQRKILPRMNESRHLHCEDAKTQRDEFLLFPLRTCVERFQYSWRDCGTTPEKTKSHGGIFSTIFFRGANFPEDAGGKRLTKEKNHQNVKKCKRIAFFPRAKRLFPCQNAQKWGFFFAVSTFFGSALATLVVDGV